MFYYPHVVFKLASGILQSPPSVRLFVRPPICPSRYLLQNHWTKFQPNLVCELLTRMGRATARFLGPTPWGPGEGPKGQISLNIIKFQLQRQFQRFLNQTLCVFSQMKNIKHSFGRLGHATGVGLGGTVGVGGSNFLLSEIQPDLVCELLT